MRRPIVWILHRLGIGDVLTALARMEHRTMGLLEEIQANQARILAALGNIATDIQSLKGQIVPGMTTAQAEAVRDQLGAIAQQAEDLAAATPDESPTP